METKQSKIIANDKFLEKVLGKKDLTILGFLVLLWLIGQVLFWFWWFKPEHITSVWRMSLNSVLLAWTFIMPAYFFFFVMRMRRPKKASFKKLSDQQWRVAMVTTKVPTEPLDVLTKTLLAMKAQKYPHDVWLGDEDPQPETIAWCKENGVKIYSRRGLADYNKKDWPRRTRCKEGNLAYFYDQFGYSDYDLVVQLDADHVPTKGYLEAIITPFLDPEVGYVSAPSICGANGANSWSARGRLYAEATMHGPLQAGYTNSFATICIGSHYATRTTALKQAGGIGPELAEDHSTSLLMQAAGWKGVHAIDAIAHGDGPATFTDCMKQEFQWARSLAVILVAWLPKYWRKLPFKLRLQFLFAQLWYPLFSLSMITGFALPIIALLTETPWVNVSYPWFVLFATSFSLISILVVWLIKRNKLLRPYDAPIISWELIVYQIVRWPWELIGVIAGTIDGLTGNNFDIKVTPKGKDAERPLPLRVVAPYILIIAIYFAAAFFIGNAGDANGYYYFILLGLLFYVGALTTVIYKHFSEAKRINQ